MQFSKLRLPLELPGPFWFEDLMFFVIDEGRRLPSRLRLAAERVRHLTERAIETAAGFDPAALLRGQRAATPAPAVPLIRDVPPMDEAESWALATEPLVAAHTGLDAALACQTAAAEQLDSLTYVLACMRDDLRPIMTTTRFKDDNVETFPDPKILDTSIEALLELSRKNAATRPKDRVQTAA